MARRTTAKPGQDVKDRIINAALALAAEQPWQDVRLGAIAERAGISLAELRGIFDGKLAILAGFVRRIDQAVLDQIDPELSEEAARERLFDVMMARIDALGPHREAVRSIAQSFERRPSHLLAWNAVTLRSMTWMLEAAGIDSSGRMGALRAQGLAVAYARTLRVWLEDDDPGMARTMVALDQRLREGESWMRRASGLCALAGAVSRMGRRRRRRRPPSADLGGETEGVVG